jgi:hypothetical protein
VTWINNEDQFLRNHELELVKSGDSKMAVLVRRYRMECGRSDMDHMKHFWRLTKTPGFTGTLVPGVSRKRREACHSERQRQRDAAREGGTDVEEEEEEEEVVTIDMAAGWQPAAGLDDG